MIRSINYTLLTDESLAKEFGNKGNSTDITIYDKKESQTIRRGGIGIIH